MKKLLTISLLILNISNVYANKLYQITSLDSLYERAVQYEKYQALNYIDNLEDKALLLISDDNITKDNITSNKENKKQMLEVLEISDRKELYTLFKRYLFLKFCSPTVNDMQELKTCSLIISCAIHKLKKDFMSEYFINDNTDKKEKDIYNVIMNRAKTCKEFSDRYGLDKI